jgi:hypothetical protein
MDGEHQKRVDTIQFNSRCAIKITQIKTNSKGEIKIKSMGFFII